MKQKLVLLSLFLITFSYAQKALNKDYSYTVSQPYKVFDAYEKYYFSKGDQVLAIKFARKEFLIQKFNANKPSFVSQKEFKDVLPKNAMIEEVLNIGSKYYLFYSSWEGDNDNEQLFSYEIDFEKGDFVGTPKRIIKTEGKIAGSSIGGWMGISMGVQNKFSFLVSHDRNSVLIQYRKKPEVKNDKKSFDIIGLVAFDKNLAELSNREMKMPYTERVMNNLDYQLDNYGNLYLLVKVFHDDSNDDKKKKKDEVANYHIELFQLKSGSKEFKISKFNNREKFVSKLWMFDTSSDFLICGGFYSNGKGSSDDSDGILVFKINKEGEIYDEVSHDIPMELINLYESKKTIKKNEKKEEKGDEAKFTNLHLKDLSIDSEGNVVLVGEQDFVITRTTYSANGGSRTTTTYYYNDILISKIGADGTLKWINKIPKAQVGANGRGGMSYKYFNANNNHYLIFLDNVKNIDLPIEKTPARHSDGKGGYLTAVKVDGTNGTFKKASIFNGREIEDFQMHQFSVGRVFKSGDTSFMLEFYKKKKEDVMVKVIMN